MNGWKGLARTSKWLVAVMIWIALASAPARADMFERAELAFARGDFFHAAELGRDARSADGFALAARAMLAHATTLALSDTRAAELRQAEKDSREALELDPGHAEAKLQRAIALGLLARNRGLVWAHFEGYATEAKELIDAALAAEPENAWAQAALGAWHLEIVSNGGAVGTAFYDASMEAGLEAFDRALEQEPGNVLILYQAALQFLSANDELLSARAVNLLRQAEQAEVDDAFQKLVQIDAQRLRLTLQAGENGAADALLRELKGLPPQLNAAGRRGLARDK